MKRLASIFAALALSLSMAFAPLAYATQAPYVIDNSGVLSSSEYSSLESKAEDMAEDYNIGEVLQLLEGSLSPVVCLATPGYNCPRKGSCKTLPLWTEFDKMVHDFLYGKKLSDLMTGAE